MAKKATGKPRGRPPGSGKKARANGAAPAAETAAANGTHNIYNPQQASDFDKHMDGLEAELETERGEYMNACKLIRADIKVLKKEMKDTGIDVPAAMAIRSAAKKIAAARAELAEVTRMNSIAYAIATDKYEQMQFVFPEAVNNDEPAPSRRIDADEDEGLPERPPVAA